jgi:RimJ/RimL family protein N-acetyltransferase
VALLVREMALDEVGLIIDYFHDSSPEHLEMLGVDPTRLPPRDRWRRRYEEDDAQPRAKRSSMLVVWELDGVAVGFSTCDRIAHGEHAFMHLHVVDPKRRRSGIGTAAVRQTAELYFEQLALQRLLCEPNAFNVAANRTLQQAGFRYVKTHMTVPGPLNYRQPVTRWLLERQL